MDSELQNILTQFRVELDNILDSLHDAYPFNKHINLTRVGINFYNNNTMLMLNFCEFFFPYKEAIKNKNIDHIKETCHDYAEDKYKEGKIDKKINISEFIDGITELWDDMTEDQHNYIWESLSNLMYSGISYCVRKRVLAQSNDS
jgi:hypothetical protein